MKKLLFALTIYFISINSLYALIEVDITRGNLDPLPIAVSPLHVDIKSTEQKGVKVKELGANISSIIEKNFKNTGLFNPLKKEAFVQKPDIAHLKPRFEDWRLIKAQALVTGKLLIKDGKLITPKLRGSILDGVTRDSIMKIAKAKLELEPIEADITLKELYNSDEVFCTGTAVSVTPVGSIADEDGVHLLSDGKVGSYTRKLKEILVGIQREEIKDDFGWLFPLK